MSIKAKLQQSGVRIFKGTPTLPLGEPALFLGIENTAPPGSPVSTVASLSSVRPGLAGYAVKELISDMELDPEAAVEKAIDIAVRGDIRIIYLNADLTQMTVDVPQSA